MQNKDHIKNIDKIINIQEQELLYEKYKTLWRAVIMQAIIDLKNNGSKNEDRKNKIKAFLWINPNKKDFKTVCERAELNPDFVYKYKLRIINNKNFKMKFI